MMPLTKDAMRLLPASAIHGSRSSASFLRIMEWKAAIRLRASTSRGAPTSMAAINDRVGFAQMITGRRHYRAIVLADGTMWSC